MYSFMSYIMFVHVNKTQKNNVLGTSLNGVSVHEYDGEVPLFNIDLKSTNKVGYDSWQVIHVFF